MNISEKHKYRGNLIICMDCSRPKSDSIHLVSELESRIVIESKDPNTTPIHRHTCTRCNGIWVHEKEADNMNCSLAEHTLCISCSGGIAAFASVYPLLSVITETENIAKQDNRCKGHVCPVCGHTWHHDYACSNKPINTACENCARQTTVETFRQTNIQQLAQDSTKLVTSQERLEILCNYRAVIWNMSHDPETRKPTDDGLEKIHNERRNLKKLIEKLRIKEIDLAQQEVDFQNEMMTSLSDEEKAQYKRDAKKKEKSAASGEKSEKKQPDQKKLYSDLIKNISNDIRIKKPKLSDEEILVAAEKRYKLMQEMDE